MSHGEECVLLHAYHVNPDYDTQPRCPECYDDLYQAGSKNDCGTCYGTTFLGGVKDGPPGLGDLHRRQRRGGLHQARRVAPDRAQACTPSTIPDIWQHDFIVRVTPGASTTARRAWRASTSATSVTNESPAHRQPARPDQPWTPSASAPTCERLSEQMPIYHYPIVG